MDYTKYEITELKRELSLLDKLLTPLIFLAMGAGIGRGIGRRIISKEQQ